MNPLHPGERKNLKSYNAQMLVQSQTCLLNVNMDNGIENVDKIYDLLKSIEK